MIFFHLDIDPVHSHCHVRGLPDDELLIQDLHLFGIVFLVLGWCTWYWNGVFDISNHTSKKRKHWQGLFLSSEKLAEKVRKFR